jgi:hypothetical protein
VLPPLTTIVIEVDDESQVTQRRAESAVRGQAYTFEVAGFVNAQAHGAHEDTVSFMIELLAYEQRSEDVFARGKLGRVCPGAGVALAACGMEEPVAVSSGKGRDDYIAKRE